MDQYGYGEQYERVTYSIFLCLFTFWGFSSGVVFPLFLFFIPNIGMWVGTK